MKRKIKPMLLALLVCLSASSVVHADEVSILKDQLSAKTAECQVEEDAKRALEEQKQVRVDEIVQYNDELQLIQSELSVLHEEISAISQELAVAQAEEDVQKKIFYKRLIVMYEKGNTEFLEALLHSDNLMDISKKTEWMKQISEYDQKLFHGLAEIRKAIDTKKQALDETVEKHNNQQAEFDQKIQSNSEEIQALDQQISETDEKLKGLIQEKNAIDAKLNRLSYAGKLIAEGEKYLGFPYVWGGSTPETSFDCSGFVCWTYTRSGVYNLPRTTAQGIYNQCKKVSRSEAKSGDLVFFTGTYQAGEPVTHIGIFTGGDQMLHCGNPIQYASIDSAYWGSHFYGFGRLGR